MRKAINQDEVADIARGILLTSSAIIGLCRQNQSAAGGYKASSVNLHICHVVKQRGTATVTEIANCLKVSQAYVSSMVDELVTQGILERKKDANDRRKCVISSAPNAGERIDCME